MQSLCGGLQKDKNTLKQLILSLDDLLLLFRFGSQKQKGVRYVN